MRPGDSKSSDSERTEIDNVHGLATQVFSRSHEKDTEEEQGTRELDSDVEKERIKGDGSGKGSMAENLAQSATPQSSSFLASYRVALRRLERDP
jgi:hypothetical protein